MSKEELLHKSVRNYFKTAAPFYDLDAASEVGREGGLDVAFYLDLARRTGGPILEFGCGTGRIGLELLKAGLAYTGVDVAPAMVAVFKDKLKAEPDAVRTRARVKEGDVRSSHLDRRYACVMLPGDILSHLLTDEDRRRALNRIKAHLTPNGVLALDIKIPTYARLGAAATGKLVKSEEELERPGEGKNKIRRTATTRFDLAHQRVEVEREWLDVGPRGGTKRLAEASLTQRYTHRYELELLLSRAGFDIIATYGSFDRKPFGPDSDHFVVISRLATPVALASSRLDRGGSSSRTPFRRFSRSPMRRPGRFGPRPGFAPSYRPAGTGYGAPMGGGYGSGYGAPRPMSPGVGGGLRESSDMRDSGTTDFPRPTNPRPAPRPATGPAPGTPSTGV